MNTWEILYCKTNRRKLNQVRECFKGTESELNEYVQKLKSEGCFAFDIEIARKIKSLN